MKKTASLTLLLLFAALTLSAQDLVTTPADRAVAERVMGNLSNEMKSAREAGRTLSTSDLMVSAARQLMGTKYVGGTLDRDPSSEKLTISLTETDCILFVETCLDLALTVKETEQPSFRSFARKVAWSRYRNAPPYRYSDRIHYTTEWIRLKSRQLEDITMQLGGCRVDHPIFYMSANYQKYKQLAQANDIPRAALDLKRIKDVEEGLNKEPMTLIPRDKVAEAEPGIHTGDIICFCSSVEGLDIAHVAIAVVEDGRVGFIHASQNEGKVVLDAKTISEYVSGRHNLSGIKVVRPR